MNERRWIYALGGLVAVLVIALVVVLVARDDNSSPAASDSTTSTVVTTVAPSTTTPVTTSPATTAAPTTAAPTSTPATTVPLPPLTNDPESYAKYLFAAWQNGNRQAAAQVASPDAVTQMFAQSFSAQEPYTFNTCNPAAGSVFCTWTSQKGSTITMTVRNTTGGLPVLVVNVARS
jgi:hypothetical protein